MVSHFAIASSGGASRKRGLTRRMSYAFTLHVFLALLYAHSIPFGWRFAFDVLLHSSAFYAALRSVDFFSFHADARHFSNLSGVAAGDSLDMLPVAARWFRHELFAT